MNLLNNTDLQQRFIISDPGLFNRLFNACYSTYWRNWNSISHCMIFKQSLLFCFSFPYSSTPKQSNPCGGRVFRRTSWDVNCELLKLFIVCSTMTEWKIWGDKNIKIHINSKFFALHICISIASFLTFILFAGFLLPLVEKHF